MVGGLKWNRVVLTNQQTVVSVNGAAATTILGDVPPNHHYYGTRCAFLEGSARLSGFTLASGGNYLGHIPSGLYDSFGGAVYCDSTSAEISDCIVNGNSGCPYGAGVFKGTLINCVLTGNNASSTGGGAYMSAVFNALAVGGLPLRYQWLREGATVPGQTNAWLAVTNVLPGDGGNLQLVALNGFGSVTSAVAVVTVSIPQPQLTASGAPGGGFRLFFQSVFGLLYVAEYQTSLGPGAWKELERRYGAGTTEIVTDTSAGGEARFYRVRALQAP